MFWLAGDLLLGSVLVLGLVEVPEQAFVPT